MIRVRSVADPDRRLAVFDVDGLTGGPTRCTFDADVDLARDGHAWLPAVLPIAMSAGAAVQFDHPLDLVGAAGASRAQQLLSGWYSDMHRVEVGAEIGTMATPRPGVGCFFSGGVDSFYSALQLNADITHLIFVHGFDIDIDDELSASRAIAEARSAALALGKPLIVVRTDVRRLSDRWCEWGERYHGPALATVGLLLADHVGRVIIPSTFSYADAHPWGSHPDLDPLWSTSGVTFEHHGAELRRAEKIAAISSAPIALQHLRVCWQQASGEYNCGRCSKCLRTMAVLRAHDALDQCATFPSTIDAGLLRRVRDPASYEVLDAKAILQVIAERGVRDRALVRELRGLIRRGSAWRRLLRGARGRFYRLVGR